MVQSAGTVTLDEQQPPRSKDGGNMVSNNLENRIECIDIIPSVKTDNLHHGAATSDFALTEAELGMKRPMTTCLDTFERNNTKSTIFEWNLSDDPPVQRSEALMCSALLDHEDSVDAFHASYSDGYLQGELDSYEPIEAIRDDFMEVEEDYNEFEEGESPSNHYLLNREALMASGPASVTKSRVVVFELLKNEKWLEIGMGICEYLRDEDEGSHTIAISTPNSNDSPVFFTLTIQKDVIYRKEKDSVIAWAGENEKHYAMSFENVDECKKYWKIIETVQKYFDSEAIEEEKWTDHVAVSPVQIPLPDLTNLKEFEQALHPLTVFTNFSVKNSIYHYFIENEIVEKLTDLFQLALDLESGEDMRSLFKIIRTIVVHSNIQFMSHILAENIFLELTRVFEYSLDISNFKADSDETSLSQDMTSGSYNKIIERKYDFINLVQEKAKWMDILSLNENTLLKFNIEALFRAQLFRDFILAKVLFGGTDDALFSLNQVIRSLSAHILEHLENTPDLYLHLMTIYESSTDDNEKAESKLKGVVGFLMELLAIMKSVGRDHIQMVKLFSLVRLLPFLDKCFQEIEGKMHPLQNDIENENSVEINGVESNNDPVELCSFLFEFLNLLMNAFVHEIRTVLQEHAEETRKKEPVSLNHLSSSTPATENTGGLLLPTIIRILLRTKDLSLQWQAVHILRLFLLSFPTVLRNEDYLNILYPKIILLLFSPLMESSPLVSSLLKGGPLNEENDLAVAAVACDYESARNELPLKKRKIPSREDHELLVHLTSLLCLAISQHSFRIKYILLERGLLEGLLQLLSYCCLFTSNNNDVNKKMLRSDKILALSIVKVVKAMLTPKDAFYTRFIKKHALLKILLELLKSIKEEDNALTSSILEIFDQLRITQYWDLVKVLVTECHSLSFSLTEAFPWVFKSLFEAFDKYTLESMLAEQHDNAQKDGSMTSTSLSQTSGVESVQKRENGLMIEALEEEIYFSNTSSPLMEDTEMLLESNHLQRQLEGAVDVKESVFSILNNLPFNKENKDEGDSIFTMPTPLSPIQKKKSTPLSPKLQLSNTIKALLSKNSPESTSREQTVGNSDGGSVLENSSDDSSSSTILENSYSLPDTS